jgi:hypothetical protein
VKEETNMTRPMSRSQRQAAVREAATAMYEALEVWYDVHPEASYEEIEWEARQHRRTLMGQVLEVLVNGRSTGFQLEPVSCAQCDGALEFKGYLPWTVHGLEGAVRLERAYYVCPQCAGETLFPPGPAVAPAGGSLECGGGAGDQPLRAAGTIL